MLRERERDICGSVGEGDMWVYGGGRNVGLWRREICGSVGEGERERYVGL